MGPNQTDKILHSKRNYKKNKKGNLLSLSYYVAGFVVKVWKLFEYIWLESLGHICATVARKVENQVRNIFISY